MTPEKTKTPDPWRPRVLDLEKCNVIADIHYWWRGQDLNL
ncbi:MAG: hypothetical protein RL114_979 [Actinomycetota bacterium]